MIYITITFTVCANVRRIRFHDPDALPARDYCFQCRVTLDGVTPDGRRVQGPTMTSSGVSACERAQPIPCMSWTGIILVFRWYMTQSEPERVMTTRTIVKISASMVQPPSEREFMCRK